MMYTANFTSHPKLLQGSMRDPSAAASKFKEQAPLLMLLENPDKIDDLSEHAIERGIERLKDSGLLNRIPLTGDAESIKAKLFKHLFPKMHFDTELLDFFGHTANVIDFFANMNPGKRLKFFFTSEIADHPKPHHDLNFTLIMTYAFAVAGTFGYLEIDPKIGEFYDLKSGELQNDFSDFTGLPQLERIKKRLEEALEFPIGTLGVFDKNLCHSAPFLNKKTANFAQKQRLALMGGAF